MYNLPHFPTIINSINDINEILPLEYKDLWSSELFDDTISLYNDIKKSFENVKKIININIETIIRIDMLTQKIDDNIYLPKFGGIPDLSNFLDYDFKNPKEYVDYHWPICGICRNPLFFIGQINLGSFFDLLHWMTGKFQDKEKKIFMSNFHIENILSAPIYENYGNWFSFFSCKNSHCTNEYSIYPCTHNCVIKYFHTTKNQSCNKKFTRDDIVNEIINSKNNYFKDEADIIYDMNINWDIVPNKNRIFSYKNYFKTRNKCYELYDKYPEIINKPKCQYRLWGGDESEFYKPDFICSTTTVPFLNQERLIRRMTPLLSYGHNQIYFDAWSFIKTEFSNDNIYAFNHIIK